MVAVIVELIEEPAAIISGDAESVMLPSPIVRSTVFVITARVSGIVGMPMFDPADRYKLASPAALVTADEADKVPSVVEKVTCALETGVPSI